MEEVKQKKDWLNIFSKLLPGVGTVLASVLIPFVLHINGEKNRNNQLYAEIVSRREISDSELRAKMFENLIRSFFTGQAQTDSPEKRLTLLRLLAFNFHEFFDLKPLFEGLEYELSGPEREKLKSIAGEIIGKQEMMLAQIKEGAGFEELVIYKGNENAIMVPPSDEPAYGGHRIGIEATDFGKDNEHVILKVIDIPDKNTEVADTGERLFKLSYFDMPFSDNTKLFDGTRFAVTLKDIAEDEKGKRAAIKVLFFPETYMSSRDRPYLEEMLNQLYNSRGKRKF